MTQFVSAPDARLAYDVAGADDPPMIFVQVRESVNVVRGDEDRSWRTAFVKGMFLPTDVVRRQAIIAGSRCSRPMTGGTAVIKRRQRPAFGPLSPPRPGREPNASG
jgi:hypothetical protein